MVWYDMICYIIVKFIFLSQWYDITQSLVLVSLLPMVWYVILLLPCCMSRNQLNQKLKLMVGFQIYVLYSFMIPHTSVIYARSVDVTHALFILGACPSHTRRMPFSYSTLNISLGIEMRGGWGSNPWLVVMLASNSMLRNKLINEILKHVLYSIRIYNISLVDMQIDFIRYVIVAWKCSL